MIIVDRTFSGRLSAATATVGVLAFWGAILMAARRYPSEYDWRYMTISRLLSPNGDPAGHLWGSVGIVLCGLCGLCWATLLARRYHRAGADRPGGIAAMQLGYIGTGAASVLPQWLQRLPKGHEILAILAWVSLWFGMMYLMFQTIERAVRRRSRGAVSHPRLYASILVGTAVLPILLAGFALGYVYFVLPQLPWVNLSWQARGVPVYLSFAFWQWITCAVLSAYMLILSVVVPAVYSASASAAVRGEVSW